MKLNREQFLGILRHVLTTLGGIMVTKGVIDETMAVEATGAIITLIGVIWSVASKQKA
jgi:hypothetical protein